LLILVLVSAGPTQSTDVTIDVLGAQESQAERYRVALARAAEYFSGWLGPATDDRLTVEVVPWDREPARLGQTTIRVPSRSFTLRGDRSIERSIIAELARRYWFDAVRFAADEQWAAGGLTRFTAVRAATELLQGDHYETASYLGGHVAFPIRYAPVTSDWWEGRPSPETFPEIEHVLGGPGGARHPQTLRATRALQTLERFLGRPVLDVAIGEFARRMRGREARVADFVSTVEDVTGRDLKWFFPSAFDATARYDYALASVDTVPGAPGVHTSRVVVQRRGDAVFSGTTQQPVGEFEAGNAVVILVRFADGTELRDHWDGRAASRTLEYVSMAAITSATVDPDLVLLLDEDWSNNHVVLAPRQTDAPRQWSLLWMAWLQQLMLSMTAAV
jgi:hypothetical protein